MPGRPARMIRSDLVKAADLGVEPVEPGGDARQMAAAVQRPLGHLDRQPGRLAEALGLALGAALFRDPVELGLGLLDLGQRSDFLAGVERAFDHIAPDPDQRPQQGQVVDLRGEVARADDRRARAGQLGQIGRPADFLDPLVGLEQRPQRHRVGDHVAVGEPEDRLRRSGRAAARRNGAAARRDLDVLDQPVVDHQRAQQRRFGLDILGERGASRELDAGSAIRKTSAMASVLPQFGRHNENASSPSCG